MPINQQFWEIDKKIHQIQDSSLASEDELEKILETNIEILDSSWLVIGRQVITSFNKRIDLLAIDNNGDLVIIELKKNRTSRDVVAQALDYASWIKKLDSADVEDIYRKYQERETSTTNSEDLRTCYKNKFNHDYQEDEINKSHKIIIVASELDSHTERIVTYLAETDIPINIVFFKVFIIQGKKIISRAWFIDPVETDEKATTHRINDNNKIPWNGEYYISFGHGRNRSWEDAQKFGFISGGGKPWYSRTLSILSVGDRVWVNIPQTGYVGVGKVTEPVQMAKDMMFFVDGEEKNIFELSTKANYFPENKDDEDNGEYLVKVRWIKTVPIKNAVKELGFFGNQNTACRPANTKWVFTIDTLKRKWEIPSI